MITGARLPKVLWGEAAHCANYLNNRTPRVYGTRLSTPEEMWTGKKPDLTHLRVFGCVAYAHLAKEQRGTLDPTAIRGILVGYTDTTRQYRVHNPQTKTVKRYSWVRFDENNGEIPQPVETPIPQPVEELGDTIVVIPRQQQQSQEIPMPDEHREPEPQPELQPEIRPEPQPEPQLQPEAAPRQSRVGRQLRAPDRYEAQLAVRDINTPETYREALAGPQRSQWEQACESELASMATNNVWELVPRPQNKNIVSCRWVFKIKRLLNGQIDRYKARLVVRGVLTTERNRLR